MPTLPESFHATFMAAGPRIADDDAGFGVRSCAPRLAGLPSSLIVVGETDPMRAEALAYGARGVGVTHQDQRGG